MATELLVLEALGLVLVSAIVLVFGFLYLR
jgi:hypothetical protein